MRKIGIFGIVIVKLLTLAQPTIAQQSLKDRIVGTWKIISWETLRPDGQVINIWMGPHPTGLIIYQSNGYMAVQIMADPRPTFTQPPATTPPSSDEFNPATPAVALSLLSRGVPDPPPTRRDNKWVSMDQVRVMAHQFMPPAF